MNIYSLSEGLEKLSRSFIRHSAIHITDNNRLYVDECLGVELFDENSVRLKTAYGAVTINGIGLKMKNYSDRGVAITGKLHSVGFEEAGR